VDRIPVGARFSTPVQTGPGAHTGTESFSGIKRLELYLDHPPPYTALVKSSGLFFAPPPPPGPSTVTFTFTEIITVSTISVNKFIPVFFMATLL
jgi:hypothetical protein